MFRYYLMVLLCIFFSALVTATVAAPLPATYSYKKIEKFYAQGKYEKVLDELKTLEKARYGKDGKLRFSLRDDILYYHYKLSSRILSNKHGSLKESVGLFNRLITLDSTKIYVSQEPYETFKDHIKEAAESSIKRNQITITRQLVNVLLRLGDTTEIYLKVFPKRESLHLANSVALREFLLNYDYAEIDQKARTTKKQGSIEDQVWALTKDYKYDFEKARAIYIWIVYNIDYDYTYRIYDGENTFKQNTGVCSGFSYLFRLMCKAAGIQSYRITGIANGGPSINHAWNTVVLEGQEFLIESTWASCVKERTNYYYLISERELSKTHRPENKN